MSKTISVVIPAYNSQSTIYAAISWVKCQNFKAHEIIVVDDGSTDRTVEEARKCESEFNQPITVIRQPNQGSAVARQTGSDAATGEYIAYLDADDCWIGPTLHAAHSVIEKESVDFLFGNFNRFDVAVPEVSWTSNLHLFPWAHKYVYQKGRRTKAFGALRIEREDGLKLVLEGFPVYPSTLVVRKEALQAVGGWNGSFRRCQDFDLALRLARRYTMYYMVSVQAQVRLHPGNRDEDAYVASQTQGDIKVLEAHLEVESEPAHREALKLALARKYAGLGRALRKKKRYSASRHAYRSAMALPGVKARSFARWAALSLNLRAYQTEAT